MLLRKVNNARIPWYLSTFPLPNLQILAIMPPDSAAFLTA